MMARPLDGIAFQAYVRQLGVPRETQELLAHIRNSIHALTLLEGFRTAETFPQERLLHILFPLR
jgi:hypothetical protein